MMKPRGLKWRRIRHSERAPIRSHQWWTRRKYFVYQVCQHLLGEKYGSPGARSHEYVVEGPYGLTQLVVYNDTGGIVLESSIKDLQDALFAAKREGEGHE